MNVRYMNAHHISTFSDDIRQIMKQEEHMPLYNKLKENRARMGINQQELGALVGASRQTISLIERGDYSPSVTLAIKIARVFEKNVDEVFDYEENEEEQTNE